MNTSFSDWVIRGSGLLLVACIIAACGGSGSGSSFRPRPAPAGLLCDARGDVSAVDNLPVEMSSTVPVDGASITTERAFSALSFDKPLVLLQAPDDDTAWYVVEKAGNILKFDNDDSVTTTTEFLDISGRVDDSVSEGGLLGMAFHPNYPSTPYVFLSYTGQDGGLTSYVSRFEANPGEATLNPGSELFLITLTQPAPNHNGGNMAFGPDGYLYLGFGDGGGTNDPDNLVQDLMNLYGSLIRIDVDSGAPYSIPNDNDNPNPFEGNELCSNGAGADDCPEIYACGFRNPWRWSFDSLTGDLWAGDVGQGALEEIDTIVNNGNYGWPNYEGTRFNEEKAGADSSVEYVAPVTEYGRSTGRSVTGGYIYRGSDIPDLVGVYVYGDFATKALFQYYDDGSGNVVQANQDSGLSISSFGQANDGELYILDYGFTDPTGIYRIIAD